MSIPGETAAALQVLLTASGLAGLSYCAPLIPRMRGGSFGYKPFLSDWIGMRSSPSAPISR